MNCKIYITNHTNPWFNLATEDWIFHQLEKSQQVLLLWRNEPSVVIGRAQNPWVECNLNAMKKHGVKLARRQSGGGTVFHDLGNLNFTFFSPREDYDKRRNLEIIVAALKDFDFDADINERNDIVIERSNETYKISGSAFRENKDFAFHHGTLLLNANKPLLRECLRAPEIAIEATGVKSVRSKVINLQELNPYIYYEVMIQAISKQFLERYQSFCNIELLEETELNCIPSLMAQFELYQTWDWQFARTLPFVHKINTTPDKYLELHINKGHIEKLADDADKHPGLLNCAYHSHAIDKALSNSIDSYLKQSLLREIP